MENDKLKAPFFISDEGYINIRLKVTTDDEEQREKLVAHLMGATYKKEGFDLPSTAIVDVMYFHNQNPVTALTSLKQELLERIESTFDTLINLNP